MSSWWSVRKKAIKKTQTYFPVNESNDQAHAVHGNVSDNQDQYNGSSSESNTPAHTEQSIPARPLSGVNHDDMNHDEDQDLNQYLEVSLLTKFLWRQFLVKL